MNHGKPLKDSDTFFSLPSIQLALKKEQKEMANVLLKVLEKVVPSEDEVRRIKNLAKKIKSKLERILRDIGIQAFVEIEGSVAKGTWISGHVDFDVFILLPPPKTRNYKPMLEELLNKIAKKTDWSTQIRYAEHPYLHIWIDNYEADIVPAFKTPPDNIVSAVDRTPHHTRYVRSVLSEELKNEVRLLKTFLRGIGAYGAEIKVGGFSGYSCELLIMHFGSFLRTIEDLSKRKRIFIDPTNTWTPKDAFRKFNHFFILVDPVDRNRNVTSALREETFSRMQLMSKLFLVHPTIKFFFPEPTISYPPKREALIDGISKRNICIIVLKRKNISPDVYWGQTFKIMHRIRRLLERSEYSLLFIDTIEGKSSMIILIETKFRSIPTPRKIVGPPTYASIDNILSFINKYYEKSIAGPWIEKSRIVFLVEETESIDDFLHRYVSAVKLEPSFHSFEIISNPKKIIEYIHKENVFRKFCEIISRRWILEYLEKNYSSTS